MCKSNQYSNGENPTDSLTTGTLGLYVNLPQLLHYLGRGVSLKGVACADIFQFLRHFWWCSVKFLCNTFLLMGIHGVKLLTQVSINHILEGKPKTNGSHTHVSLSLPTAIIGDSNRKQYFYQYFFNSMFATNLKNI